MPAPRASGGGPRLLSGSLAEQAPARAVLHVLSLNKYYNSANLLLKQAAEYRKTRNEEQLYVMLLRFTSLMVETIPKHKDFRDSEKTQYLRLKKQLIDDTMPELERIKLALDTRDIMRPEARSMNRPANLLPLTTSALPDINWGNVALPEGGGSFTPTRMQDGNSGLHVNSPPSYADFAIDDLLEVAAGGSRGGSYHAPPPPQQQQQMALYGSPYGSSAYGTNGSNGGGGTYPDYGSNSGGAAAAPAYAPSYFASNSATSQRHMLFGAPSSSSGGSGSSRGPMRTSSSQYGGVARYPVVVDLTPPPQVQPPLLVMDRPSSSPPWPQPSAGPTLQPQELEVLSLDARDPFRPATCGDGQHMGSLEASAPPPPPATAAPGGPSEIVKKAQMRDVHISLALMEEFLAYANANTKRNIESCGILSGVLSANDSTFTITTLIIPQQKGTTDTVAAENEEDIFEAQFKRELYPMGWIHTHPSQTCFLSSIDVHTQCGYQTMLDEAVAIVMAPSDTAKRCGIFRLTTPGGLSLIQKCSMHGFHTHPDTHTGQPAYELCGHVYLNPRVKHEVIDLRTRIQN